MRDLLGDMLPQFRERLARLGIAPAMLPRDMLSRNGQVGFPDTGSVELRWLPRGAALPKGWRYADQAPAHHDFWATLIERAP